VGSAEAVRRRLATNPEAKGEGTIPKVIMAFIAHDFQRSHEGSGSLELLGRKKAERVSTDHGRSRITRAMG
jgi:hypothetical protein